MLLSASQIQDALNVIATNCEATPPTDTGSSSSLSGLGVSAMSIEDDLGDRRWQIQQSFPCSASSDPSEADFVSTVQFDQTGEFIAAATRLGKIGVYQRTQDKEDAKLHPY